MKILHLESIGELPEHLQKELNAVGEYVPLIQADIPKDQVLKEAKDAEVIIIAPSALKPVDGDFINQLEKTKHIALVTVGYDWVDVEACRKKAISISRPVGANSEAVAEHTIGLLIDLAKRITEFNRDVRKGAIDFRKYQGVELFEKTLGIIGLGNVGHRVCRIAQGFNMQVLAFDRSETSTDQYQIVDLKTLLSKSDFIAVCMPLSPETKNLIGEKEINQMKNGVIVANTAREEIVNKQAVINGIKSGRIFGYGVETAIMTPLDKNDRYFQYPNIIVNPHNAFNTKETARRVSEMVVNNVINFINGEPKNLLE